MTAKAPIPGAFDSITAQQTFAADGGGSMNFLGVPILQLSNGKAFRVLNAVIFVFSDNSNGTIDRVWPGTNTSDVGLGFVIPSQKTNPGDILASPLSVPPPLASFGPAVNLLSIATEASAGNNQDIYVLDSNREIVVPFGYNWGVWVRDSADGTPHNLTVTIFAQIQYLENPSDCNC